MHDAGIRPPGGRARESVVWIDRTGGLVVDPEQGEDAVAELFARRPGETDGQLAARIVQEVETSDRVFVIGPETARLDFEREFVALVKAPERLIDVDPTLPLIEAAAAEGRTR